MIERTISRTLARSRQEPIAVHAVIGGDDRERLSHAFLYGRYLRKASWVGRDA